MLSESLQVAEDKLVNFIHIRYIIVTLTEAILVIVNFLVPSITVACFGGFY